MVLDIGIFFKLEVRSKPGLQFFESPLCGLWEFLLSSSATLSSAVGMNSAGFILTSWAFNHSIKVAPFYGLKVSCHEH